MPSSVRNIVISRKFASVCFFISIPFQILGSLLRVSLLLIIAITMIVTAIITTLLFWRCPRCKRLLATGINAKDFNNDIDGFYVCPHCNTKFSSYDIIS